MMEFGLLNLMQVLRKMYTFKQLSYNLPLFGQKMEEMEDSHLEGMYEYMVVTCIRLSTQPRLSAQPQIIAHPPPPPPPPKMKCTRGVLP